jgi:hypothetical protein
MMPNVAKWAKLPVGVLGGTHLQQRARQLCAIVREYL